MGREKTYTAQFWGFFLLMLMAIAAKGQHYTIERFTEADGLNFDQVSDIVQDWRGYIWIGTYGGGVNSFDGKRFNSFDENSGLTSNRVRALELDQEQTLWVGTLGGGISMIKHNNVYDFRDSVGTLSDFIYDLFLDSRNRMWIGTREGLYYYDKGVLRGLSETMAIPMAQVQQIHEDNEGNIWVAFWEHGLVRLEPTGEESFDITTFSLNNGLLDNTVTVIREAAGNSLWLGTLKGLQRLVYGGGNFLFYTPYSRKLPHGQVFDVLKTDYEGIFLSFGKDGVYRILKEDSLEAMHFAEDVFAYKFFEDAEHMLWISDWENGLLSIKEGYVNSYQDQLEVPVREMRSFDMHRDRLYISSDAGLIVQDSGGFQMKKPTGIADGYVETTFTDAGGQLWMFAQGRLFHRTATGWEDFEDYKAIIPSSVLEIAQDATGDLWLAPWGHDIVKYDGTSFSIIRDEKLQGAQHFYDALALEDGSVWFASQQNGVFRIADGVVTNYNMETGLPSNRVTGLAADSRGGVWMACQNGGLVCIMNGEIAYVQNLSTGLSDDVVSVYCDQEDVLWAGSKGGVFAVPLNKLWNNETFTPLLVDETDGLPSDECQIGCLIGAGDIIWAATKSGVAAIRRDIVSEQEYETFPTVFIADVLVNFKNVRWQDYEVAIHPVTGLPVDFQFGHDQNQLSFIINGVSTRSRERIHYKYKLEGLDETWSPLSSAPVITYHDVSPGEYTLHVVPCNERSLCSEGAVTFHFSVARPFWKAWWFYLIILMLINLLFFLVIRLREHNLKESRIQLEKKVRKRTAEIELQKRIIEENNRNMTDSIRYAKRIQKAMLSSESEMQLIFPDSFILYIPKDIVSGDFYFSTRLADKHIVLVSDCTGHGVPGAVMSMLGYSVFNEAIRKKELVTTDEIMNFVSQSVIRMLHQKERNGETQDGMDASIIVYDPTTERLQYSGAHNSIYVISGRADINGEKVVLKESLNDKNLYELKADKQPIGINKNGGTDPFTETTISLTDGDMVYLFSDGYADQFGGITIEEQAKGGKKIKTSQVRKMLLEISGLSMEDQKNELQKFLARWKGPLEQVDDITFVGFRV